MDMIEFHGLNCYHGCIVNGAKFLGTDYLPSFSNLWSETDFSYDPIFNMYLTKRMISNLHSLGIVITKLPCSNPEENENSFKNIDYGSWFIAGMDAFYMPWNQYYQTLNGYHYFLAEKKQNDMLCCFDPMYDQRDIFVKSDEIMPYVFDIITIQKGLSNQINTSVKQEAKNILSTIDNIGYRLTSQIENCVANGRKNAVDVAIYADAMLTNRHLYFHYLENNLEYNKSLDLFFTQDYIKKWLSIKNGLLKASLISENKDTLKQVIINLEDLISTDKQAANWILQA